MITVIDSIMGSGKTTWGINYINTNVDENILYITPFKDEIERIIANCPDKKVYQPEPRQHGSKLINLNELLGSQMDIASTHELFKRVNDETKRYIEEGQYTLILDEVLEVIRPFNGIRADDLKILKESDCISIDKDNFIIWKESKEELDTRYNDMKLLAKNRCLVLIDNKVFLWQYPPEIFKLFKKVYIMTYLFEASCLKCYFDLYGIEYEKKSLNENHELCDYFKPDKSKYKDLINIYQGPLNKNISEKPTALSSSWFNRTYNKGAIDQLRKNCTNYYKNIVDASGETVLWTTYEKSKSFIKGKGYTKGFIACNCRSTNEYRETYNLAYILNMYLNPEIKKFFEQRGITVNDDLYSLSELLQWIWRSRIRNDESINIYIPSSRMRNLLTLWINDKIA